MTFWQFITEHKVKILGALSTVVAGLLGMIALKMFDGNPTAVPPVAALLGDVTIRWMTVILTIANMLLGGGTIAAGTVNSTKIRVAEAKAEVANAMVEAINTPPPVVVINASSTPPIGG